MALISQNLPNKTNMNILFYHIGCAWSNISEAIIVIMDVCAELFYKIYIAMLKLQHQHLFHTIVCTSFMYDTHWCSDF